MLLNSTSAAESLGTTPRAPSWSACATSGVSTLGVRTMMRTDVCAAATSCSVCNSGIPPDRKSTRLNSSHVEISYAVFCLKKKKQKRNKIISKKKKQKESNNNI